ncbi:MULTISPECIES: ATP-binding sensor histidine kinase [unclassified Tolypothrix]|uniref:ATP-binding sensor histidine kinase n=1 Tax=unclassified Tolypothrix TaxID=2649714 RepID=UPI0005EAA868|nr:MULTISPECIES: ATP-binding sensor histidine kinase [unclassified Tolypothrix]BAY92895.1 serine/threonine protein kinase with two-component sensor domain [Microchaete diplosiphon NIES-3275]EKF02996.1 PAS domain S-box [Tolypothrix sp. PCC 7601]MBE9082277.1 AAA family ATPase [Tolypothrix sp. LEGE 11397]UYD26802.1 AAA family ATPase [Tolypothrix sp. PCC 7712]UYD37341.1 AAA family ATPase [Tolypothrix sp. PCC 7601]
MVSTLVSIPGYRIIEELYNGSRTIVYRAVRETDSVPVVIKLLKNPYPSFSELLLFRNQYTIGKNLNSPLIIQTYSLDAINNGYMLVMEDFGGISLKDYFTKNQSLPSLAEFLAIAIALCDTLNLLYHERIIHKDIKPSNILINPETKQIKLIDFSIASLLPRETQTLIKTNVLEGTLAYISPEQTGRMNRVIDYRTDFYSLGVNLYELLTGELPFASSDPMELVHCHIAKTAPLVHKINPQIPSILSAIVSKLMAKNAEDRYQSALGLKYDLENCLSQLQETGEIEDFAIATRDVCDRFIIPDKLYGRDTEVQTLLLAFERVSQGTTEMMLVAGFSGIGKTAVVNEVHKPIVRQRGYFIKGKYDQFNRNIPLSAFVQAFRDLMGQLLTESEAKIQQWKHKILEAVGDNGQVIIEVIPELARIIGEQPPAVELSGTEAENRFNLLFQKFTQVFTSVEHPLVMFLDDLQWADSASLKLMQLLITDTSHLLLIAAYRDNEVPPGHPLMLTLSDIQKKQAKINTITLAALTQKKVNQLVADTLKCAEELAEHLSELIYQKTKGNPFFATQFLKALHEDGLIQFNFELGCWQCDIAQVKTQAVTDDVVAFMSLQLQKLPLSTQSVLQLAACIGNSFDLNTLAIVSQQSQIETASALWKALQEGLILPVNDVYKFYVGQATQSQTLENQETVTYKFLHDRVQQAAYSLIADEEKQSTHLQIGQLLLQNSPPSEREERLFDIVNHLNFGIALVTTLPEREHLAELNLAAGRKAKTANAHSAAINYLGIGIELLPATAWESHYPLTLALYEEIAEASYVKTDFEQMEQWASVVLQQAHTLLDTIKVQQARILGAKAQGQFLYAVEIGLQVLRSLGIEFPEQPNEADIGQAFALTRSLWADKSPLELLDLPTMSNPHLLAAMELLTVLVPAAYMGSPNFMPLMIGKQIELSIQSGNCPSSIFSYVDYGLVLCGIVGDIDNGYLFGELALSLLERIQLSRFKSRSWYVVYHFIKHWKTPLAEILLPLQEAYSSGLETGEVETACFNAAAYCYYSYHTGQELTELAQKMNTYLHTIHQYKQTGTGYWLEIYQQTVFNLLGRAEVPYHLIGTIFDLHKSLPELQATNQRSALLMAHLNQMFLYYLFGKEAEAIESSAQAAQYIDGGVAMFVIPLYSFYDALIQLTQYAAASTKERQTILLRVQQHQDKLQHWATLAACNHRHRWELVAAEHYRVLGNKIEAIECYDRAIFLAKENKFIQDEALANELAAKFYLDWSREKFALLYMQEAYYCYSHWGAKAKVEDLEKRYPQLLKTIIEQRQINLNPWETITSVTLPVKFVSDQSDKTGTSIADVLDFNSILKAAQTISSKIELDELITNLTQIILQNSGADKSALILNQDDVLQIRAITSINEQINSLQTTIATQLLDDCRDVPVKMINYVKNTQQTIVIDNCQTDFPGLIAEYMLTYQPQSVLCTPIINQGNLVGILYLESRAAAGVFTKERLQVIQILSAQAAIALENARLYQQMQEAMEKALLNQISIDQTNVSVWWIEPDGRIFYVNDATCKGLGYRKEEMISKYIFDFDPVFPKESWPEHWQDICQQGSFTIESYHRHKSGNIYPVEVTVNYVKFKDKEYNFVFTKDISERKQAEAEILQKSQELTKALQNLQQANLQIVQSEKMSALGNLVAGVAHEMNNPLGFIYATLQQTKPALTDIVQHLQLYQETLPNPSDKIRNHAQEIDLDYSLEDLPQMLDAMVMACDRLKNISTSLRTFSRADKDYKVLFNIHEGIDSTILILKHRLKANEQRPAIKVLTEYGDLPQVECFPGQLNQVFMNILANAIDALDESNHGRSFEDIKVNSNSITITTSIVDKYVKISIADNGKGMSEEVKHKIFDHLFTTKAVGKGTGLGLAIAKKIVEETHGGKLSCQSTLSKGTAFIIEIPV